MDSPKFKKGIEKGNAMGMTNRDIAAGLGLNIPRAAVDLKAETQKEVKNQAKNAGKTQFWESGLLGIADIGVPVVQAAEYAADGIRGGVNKVLGTNLDTNRYEKLTKNLKDVNDWHGLRRQENKQGMDLTRMGANMLVTAPLASLGGTLKAGVPLASKAGVEFLGKNAALGALIGATGVHENNTERLKSMAAGALGGAIGAGAGQKVGEGVGYVARKSKAVADNLVAKVSPERTNQILQNIDDKLNAALKPHGIKITDLSDDIAKGLRADAKKALQSGYNLNEEAVMRKAVFDRLGLKGTQAQVTGDARLWQQERELAKLNGVGDSLNNKFIDDNARLAGLLDDVATKTGGNSIDEYGAIKNAADSLLEQNAQNKSFVGAAYDAAAKAPGNDVLINGQGFSNDVFTALDDQALATFLPADIRNIVKQINDNPQYFTLKKGEELIKVLNNHYKSSMQMGQPTATTQALGVVRQALQNRQDEALQGLLSQGGNDAAQLYQFARQAHRFNRQQVESIPLLKDALKGVEPDKLFNKHILNGNVAELDETVKVLKNVNPQAVGDIKQQTVEFIIGKSINQNGQFSPAGMSGALKKIGDRRLSILFSPKEMQRIKDIGRAGHYLVTQPAHSNVNHSNTASGLMNYFGTVIKGLGNWGQHIPVVGNNVVQPVSGGVQRAAVSSALNSNPSLAGSALPPTWLESQAIQNLVKLGVLGGANLPE